MLIQVPVYSFRPFSFQRLSALLGVDDLVLVSSPNETPDAWFFYRRKHAVTMFMIEKTEDAYVLSMDRLASYDDYRFLPYLVDTLTFLLTDNPYRSDNGEDVFSVFNEEWAAEAMGEEVAFLKCFLSLGMKYYVALPISEANVYVCNEALNAVGVSMYSSTPRIFGYVSYLLRHHLLPADAVVSPAMMDEEVQVDVPQHHSLATVRSWQTDGAETTESYCKEDVELLLQLSRKYKAGEPVEGVVLNDIGTIFEYGIGVEQDVETAIYWFEAACCNGDLLYAPTNLGDIYRKGRGTVGQNLPLAVEAYSRSEDPYAWYRIGQSYEEGWNGEKDMEKAMAFYRKAADARHHLALKRLREKSAN